MVQKNYRGGSRVIGPFTYINVTTWILPNISRFGNAWILAFEPKTRNNGKQLTRSKIDSMAKLLSFVCESFPSILSFCTQNSLFCLQNCCNPSILIDLRAWVFSTIDKYQKLHVLVAKLFTIFTRTCSGSYAISWLECRQTNMFDAKTVILYWTSNITKFTVQQFFYVKSMLIH